MRSHPHGRDRGSATLEMTILFPALLLVVCSVFQAGLWFFARNAAIAAAEEGARVVSLETGTAGEGRAVALAFMERVSTGLATGISARAARTGTLATVTVTATSLSIIPGMEFDIAQSATLPVERITK